MRELQTPQIVVSVATEVAAEPAEGDRTENNSTREKRQDSGHTNDQERAIGGHRATIRSRPPDQQKTRRFTAQRRYSRHVPAIYETIGQSYASTRRPDPRIAQQILVALGSANTVLNVGAGAGSYEPTDRQVIAIDPSVTMLTQRSATAGAAVCGVAEALPFRDGAFDVAMGTMTLHHWPDLAAGLAEVRRVSSRQVFMLYEPSHAQRMWILQYFPEILELPHEQRAPSVADIGSHLSVQRVEVVQIPSDCTDGFGGAFWSRPEYYLDPAVQAGMSMFALLDPAALQAGTQRLRESLDSGEWDDRYRHLRTQPSGDLGYRLVIAGPD
jgi:SAM-dependent methyltransferase